MGYEYYIDSWCIWGSLEGLCSLRIFHAWQDSGNKDGIATTAACGRYCRSFLFRYGIMLRWWRHKKQGSDSQLTKRSRGSHTTVMDTFIFYHFRGNPKISTYHSVWKSPKMSSSTLRAKRATFTIWVDKSSLKLR